jgi:hypothetical protein
MCTLGTVGINLLTEKEEKNTVRGEYLCARIFSFCGQEKLNIVACLNVLRTERSNGVRFINKIIAVNSFSVLK